MKKHWSTYLASSLLAHTALALGIGHVTPQATLDTPVPRIEFVPIDLPPPPPPEPPEPPEPPPEPPISEPLPERTEPVPVKSTRPRAESSAPTEQIQSAETTTAPLRLGGVALSNSGLAFATGGSGVSADHQQKTNVRANGRSLRPPKPEPTPPLVMRLADLSRRPVPPSLDARLKDHYPSELKQRGVEGEALVRLTLSESGAVIDARAVSQTDPAFAHACRRTLLGTRWSPPLDQNGNPVRTTLDYRCRFRVAL